ncbi:MAG: hypothetical protein BGO01_10825 [Armatimonadetes bacterium 55-13]|nr:MAG: hypothetical protein BGO01_10825 [Armatimonadetes bacterium 55-13]
MEGVLGTTMEVQVVTENASPADQVHERVLAEIDRLEAVFSVFRPDSELNRWQRGEIRDGLSPELMEVLTACDGWMKWSSGALNPAVESLTRLWRDAEQANALPEDDDIQKMRALVSKPLWDLEGTPTLKTELPISLNALAKGYIVDKSCQVLTEVLGVSAGLINIGGDIRHFGSSPTRVSIQDPFTTVDNATPVASVLINGEGICTSGPSRRGFLIAGQRFSHIIDPRTGYPTERTASASVIAPSAMEADALATIFCVLTPQKSLALADTLPDVRCLLFTDDGAQYANARWLQTSNT